MHPILGRGGRLALYLGVWIFVGGLLALLLALQGRAGWMLALAAALPLATAYAFVCLSAWYVARGMPLAISGPLRIVATALIASVVSSAVWVAMARAWVGLLARRSGDDVTALFGPLGPLLFGFGMLLYLLSLAVSYLFAAYEASQELQRRGLQAQVLAREAELRSLRAQVDPHFLFNSLHSISALTTADPPSARRMCLLLGDFMRETVALGGEERITLGREMSLAERFLAIEQVRFGDRLKVDVSLEPEAAPALVPPLLIQPLVENAVTHGIAHVLEGGTVRVRAHRAGTAVRITVENPADPERPRGRGTGVGLANVRARLRALHGGEAKVLAEEADGVWRCDITVPAEPSPISSS